MFIRLQKELDQKLKHNKNAQCYHCGNRLLVPPVVEAYDHLYHADCALQLAYSILFSMTGKPDLQMRAPDMSRRVENVWPSPPQ